MIDCALRLVAGLMLLVVSGCMHMAAVDSPPKSPDRCCTHGERYPRWLVAIIEPTGPVTGRIFARISSRRGYLSSQNGAFARMMSVLSPLDIILVKNGGSLSSNNIPGHFSHAIVYLGPDRELRQLGVWRDKAANVHRTAIRAGKTMIEADARGVHLSTPASIMNTDRLLVLRPEFAGRQCRLRTTVAFLEHLGTPFDFSFDSSEDTRLFCTELIDHVAPDLGLPSRTFYGRPTIFPDHLAEAATRPGSRLQPVLYLKGDSSGWRAADSRELRADVAKAWSR